MKEVSNEQILTNDYAVEIFETTQKLIRLLMEVCERREKIKSQEIIKEQPNTNSNQEKPQARLIPVTKWNKYYDYPTIGGLRSLIFNENTNGFNKVVRRIGGRVLIKEDAFFEWVENTNANK